MLVWPTFCAACGHGLRREDKFCSNCGVPVPQEPFESAGTMAHPGLSDEAAPEEVVQPESFHEPSAEAPIPAEPLLFPEERQPPEPLLFPVEVQAAEPLPPAEGPQVAEPNPPAAGRRPAEVRQHDENDGWPAGVRRLPTAYDRVPPPPTPPDRLPRPIVRKPQTKAGLPVLEILIIILLLVGAAVAVWMLHSSQPVKQVAVPANVAVTLSPATARVVPGHALDFAATVTGTDDVEVEWTVQEGDAGGRVVPRGAKASGKKISSLAVYIAPDSPGTYHLVATSKADSEKSVVAEITVKATKSR